MGDGMNFRQQSERRKQWGDKPCDHPQLVKEDPMFGQWSGDMVCTQCGLAAPRDDFEAMKARQEPAGRDEQS